MAALNVITDIALILTPIPLLWKLRLSMKQLVSDDTPQNPWLMMGNYRKLQLSFIFGVGIFVIAVTIIRVPVTLGRGASQKTRSMVLLYYN